MTCKRSLVQVQPESPFKDGVFMFLKFLFLSGFIISLSLSAENLEIKDPDELGVSQLDIDNLFNLSFEDASTQSVALLKDCLLYTSDAADDP